MNSATLPLLACSGAFSTFGNDKTFVVFLVDRIVSQPAVKTNPVKRTMQMILRKKFDILKKLHMPTLSQSTNSVQTFSENGQRE